jgi:hypothetical protein
MSFKLSKEDSIGKTELLAQALERHIVVCAQIDAFNAMLEAARETIEGARQEYAAAVEQLRDFAEMTARTGREALAAKPQKWQESAAGEEVRDWLALYEAFRPEVPTIEYPQEIDGLDEVLLTNFEELPDDP